MKISITRKLIISYLVLLIVSALILSVLSSFFLRSTMEDIALESMNEDINVINEELGKVIRLITVKDMDELRQRIRERIEINTQLRPRVIRLTSLETGWMLVSKDLASVMNLNLFSQNKEEAEFKKSFLAKVKEKYDLTNKEQNNITIDNIEYLTLITPLTGAAERRYYNASVIYFAPIGPVNALTRKMLQGFFIAILITGFVVIVFGVIIAKSIAKPIIVLKNRALLFSKRDFDTKISVNTGDELEDLANTFNEIASELKEYDISQKRFLQNASHELKTPLMSIQGYAEGIKDGVFQDSDRALEIITDESKRMKKIVDELIFLSKLETMEDYYQFDNIPVDHLLFKSIDKVMSIALKNNVNIIFENRLSYYLYADFDKLTQAFINIIVNCIIHAKKEVVVSMEQINTNLQVDIYDDGDGFSEKDISNIFERFYKGNNGNTGLGLAITKVIIEKHRGTISAYNRKAGGAQYTITFMKNTV